jgi:hypothetical protein
MIPSRPMLLNSTALGSPGSRAALAPALSGNPLLKPLKDLLRVRTSRSRHSILFTSSRLRLRRSGCLSSSHGYRLAATRERRAPASEVRERACRASRLSWYRRSERRARRRHMKRRRPASCQQTRHSLACRFCRLGRCSYCRRRRRHRRGGRLERAARAWVVDGWRGGDGCRRTRFSGASACATECGKSWC